MQQSSGATTFTEWIHDEKENTLALIIRNEFSVSATQFVTPEELNQQVGFVVYSEGEKVNTHMHLPIERHIVGTSEVLMVRRGRAVLRLYDSDKTLAAKRELKPGDLVLLISGWHGLEFLEDTVLLEIKQGPYLHNIEKRSFKKED